MTDLIHWFFPTSVWSCKLMFRAVVPEDTCAKLAGRTYGFSSPHLAPFPPTSCKWAELASSKLLLSHQGQDGSGEVWKGQHWHPDIWLSYTLFPWCIWPTTLHPPMPVSFPLILGFICLNIQPPGRGKWTPTASFMGPLNQRCKHTSVEIRVSLRLLLAPQLPTWLWLCLKQPPLPWKEFAE